VAVIPPTNGARSCSSPGLPGHPRFWIVRTQWVFGPDGRNFVDTILAKAAQSPELRVVTDQRGSQTYTVDLAAQIRRIVEGGGHGLYHVSSADEPITEGVGEGRRADVVVPLGGWPARGSNHR